MPKNNEGTRKPPGSAVKPLLLVASVLGANHKPVPSSMVPKDFNGPPATDVPPRQLASVVNSSNVGTCHPVGVSRLGSFITYQLYNLPYVVPLAEVFS